MGILRVKHPFTEGIKQDISGQAGGEHHGTPGKKRVFWLFFLFPQADGTVPGKSQIEGEKKDTKSHGQVPGTKGFLQEAADGLQAVPGSLRRQKEGNTKQKDAQERNCHGHPVQLLCEFFFG